MEKKRLSAFNASGAQITCNETHYSQTFLQNFKYAINNLFTDNLTFKRSPTLHVLPTEAVWNARDVVVIAAPSCNFALLTIYPQIPTFKSLFGVGAVTFMAC